MSRSFAALAALLLAGCLSPDPSPGAAAIEATPLGGAPPLAARIVWSAPFPAAEAALSSPLLFDVDGDGTLDAIAANGQGYADATEPGKGVLRALSGADGRELWSNATGAVDSSPALADVTGDGRADAVVGLRDRRALLLFDPATGAGLATLPLENWVHSAAVAEDGAIFLVTGGDDAPTGGKGRAGELLRLRGALEAEWRVPLADEAYSSPALADGLVLHGVGGQLGGAGAIEARRASDGAIAWREETRTGVLASPALADLDGDGALDVVFAEWWGAVHARRASDGARSWDAETRHLAWTSPALADVSGDGRADVVVTGYRTAGLQFETFAQAVNGKHSLAAGTGGFVAALDGATGRALWARGLNGTAGSPVVADVTGDGRADVLVATAHGSRGYFGESGGALWALEGATGDAIGALALPGGVISTPAIGDVDRDGRPDVVLSTVKPALTLRVEMDDASDLSGAPSWLRWRGNERGTGVSAGP